MRTIEASSWKNFRKLLDDDLPEIQKAIEDRNCGRPLGRWLCRGHGNAAWLLETTLERSSEVIDCGTLGSYYRKASRSKPAIESITGRSWDPIPDWPEFRQLLQQSAHNWLDRMLPSAVYQYLIYLRHHGFPSPLLDWTHSPYVAAFFAFDSMDPRAEKIAIHIYARDAIQAFGSDAHLFRIGEYIRTHPRHYLQQSDYTLCVSLQTEHVGEEPDYDYKFLPHHAVLEGGVNSDLNVRITIPAIERRSALEDLDQMNLNPYSVYASEDSLIRTIARRELFFR